MNRSRPSFTLAEAISKMERYCIYQERCHQEVNNKLRQMKMIPQAIDRIMVHLIENGFLNESRFAQAYTRGKFTQKQWGRLRIRRELKNKNISDYNIKHALATISTEEYHNSFNRLADKRWESLNTETDIQKKRKKLVDYLHYRGWESELVYQKLAELDK